MVGVVYESHCGVPFRGRNGVLQKCYVPSLIWDPVDENIHPFLWVTRCMPYMHDVVVTYKDLSLRLIIQLVIIL